MSESGGANEEDMRIIKQILLRYWRRKLCSLVLDLYIQLVRVSEGDAYLVSISWAELRSWCAQTNHQSCVLSVRRGGSWTPYKLHTSAPWAALVSKQGSDSQARIQGPIAWKSCAHFIPTGWDWQEPAEHYCNGCKRVIREKEKGRKKQTDWNGRGKLKQMLIILKA